MMSELDVHIIQSFDSPGRMGETWPSQIVPAVTNGIFVATGKRLRKLPVDTIAVKQPANRAGTKNPSKVTLSAVRENGRKADHLNQTIPRLAH